MVGLQSAKKVQEFRQSGEDEVKPGKEPTSKAVSRFLERESDQRAKKVRQIMLRAPANNDLSVSDPNIEQNNFKHGVGSKLRRVETGHPPDHEIDTYILQKKDNKELIISRRESGIFELCNYSDSEILDESGKLAPSKGNLTSYLSILTGAKLAKDRGFKIANGQKSENIIMDSQERLDESIYSSYHPKDQAWRLNTSDLEIYQNKTQDRRHKQAKRDISDLMSHSKGGDWVEIRKSRNAPDEKKSNEEKLINGFLKTKDVLVSTAKDVTETLKFNYLGKFFNKKNRVSRKQMFQKIISNLLY